MTPERALVLRYLAASTPEPETVTDGTLTRFAWYRGPSDIASVTLTERECLYSCTLPNGMRWSGRCQIGNRAALELFALRFGLTLGPS